MDYLDKFDKEVLKFCLKNHEAKGKMKEKLKVSGRNQRGHFVAGKPVRAYYDRFSIHEDFTTFSPATPSVLGTPVSHYFTQDYPLPTTLSDYYTPSKTERKRLERQRTIKEAQELRPAELSLRGEPGRPPQIDLELPIDIQRKQAMYRFSGMPYTSGSSP